VTPAEANAEIVVHAVAAPDGGDVGPPIIVRVSCDRGVFEDAARGLPVGPATPEAVAARIDRSGARLVWGEPERARDAASFLRLCRERGAASIEIYRADPSLLPRMQLGSFFAADVRRRALRRALVAPALTGLVGRLRTRRFLLLAADAAFWSGVRSTATAAEWERLTRSSYVVLYYHRIAGEEKPGQERLDVAPETFERQIKWLRRLRLQPLAAETVAAFHEDADALLPRRAFVLAADDGFRDAVVGLIRHADLRPFCFVPTSAVGGRATWIDGEPTASWAELLELASGGGEIASHAHTHVILPELDEVALTEELRRSLREVRERLPGSVPMLAYPHGRSDPRVRSAAAAAGYRIAFTTETGRNGAGTDPFALRRVGLKGWDGPAAVAWKALTGELNPWPLERLKVRLYGLRRGRRRASRRR
jgi:peptidoglycan/xylan/chitin deacetylase (PgdA/CDA1 family)